MTSSPPNPTKYVFAGVFSIFGLVGITILIFLWMAPDQLGDPPLFFRVTGSLIALGFVAFSAGAIFLLNRQSGKSFTLAAGRKKKGSCRNCGAKVESDGSNSPETNASCQYCGSLLD